MTIPVHLDTGDEIADDCVAADVYFGDDKLSASAVATALLTPSGADRVVRVSTKTLINEPVVTVYLAVGCKAKITRKFVAFADPPGLVSLAVQGAQAASAVMPAASAAPVAQPSLKTSALVAASTPASGDGVARASKPQAPNTSRSASPSSVSEKPSPTATTRSGSGAPVSASVRAPVALDSARSTRRPPPRPETLSAKVDARPRAAEGARLELDPVEADAVVAPTLMMSSSMAQAGDPDAPEAMERRAAAAALWAAMNASPEQLARDRQRMQELEQRLARLQQDSAGARKKVSELEARVQDAEENRLSHPLVYALAGACALLAAAVGWLFMRQRREQEAQGSWWQGDGSADGAETAPVAMAEPALARTSAEFMPVRPAQEPAVQPSQVAPEETSAGHVGAAMPLADVSPSVAQAGRVEPSGMVKPSALIKSEAQEAVRSITVEELIDLEQQAEFFVVLGQDEAAIELLESHIHTSTGASPLPYLKLLEIYQRLGRRDDYERTQSEFNARFNAYAPSWESDLQQGHSLQDYPGVIERLQALWSQPAKAMDVLQMSLTRPDASTETFDLPAYRELLFLYGVARDLSERESQNRVPVDLLRHGMPVDVEGHEISTQVEPLMATRPVKAVPQATPSLSLDLSLDDPVSGPGGFVDEPMAHMDVDIGLPGLDSHGRGGATPDEGQHQQGRSTEAGNAIDFVPTDLPPRQS